MLEAIAERVPLGSGGDGKSGSRIERVTLADGRGFVVKHVSPAWDWIMRATHDAGRIAVLANGGTLRRVPGVITPWSRSSPRTTAGRWSCAT